MRRLWRRWLPLLLIGVMTIVVACGDDDEETTAAPTGIDAQQVLKVNLGAEPDTLDPQRATDVDSITVLRNIYSTVLRIDQNLELEADLAEQIPTVENGGISADGLTYTFKLRDNLKWSDGTDLKAQAFVDGAKRLFEPGSGNYYVDFYRVLAAGGNNLEVEKALAAGAEDVSALENAIVAGLEVSAPDDRTVVYKLNRQSPVFLLLTTMWPLYPVRQDLIDQHGEQWTEAGTLIANGAFVLTQWNHSENIVLTRNDEYHGDGPILETVEIDMIEDTSIAFLAYLEGELDIISLGAAELVQVRGSDLEREFRPYAALVTIGVYFNVDDPMLSDPRVRQALAGAFDRTEYAEVVREGAVLPAYAWVPPGMPGHDSEAGRQYADAIAASQQLLVDAGYPGGEGLEITILDSTGDTSDQRDAWFKDQWETNLGISVKINQLERSTYFAERNAGNYQVTLGGWGADYPDPQNWLPLFKTGGLLNSGNFSDADFDRLIAAADVELDNAKRIDLYKQAQVVMLDQLPFSPLYHGRHNILVKPWVQDLITGGLESGIPGDPFFASTFIRGR
ncbi:MAG: peptide ABC transporter substrate-binding protein [Dehalococcoidia bacterium]